MAPEILNRLLGQETRESLPAIDYPATDMWALGVMAFRMLTGAEPFAGLSDVVRYYNHPELFPHSLLDDCHASPDGTAFIRESMQPKPSERLRSSQAACHSWVRRYGMKVPVNPAVDRR